MNHSFKFDNAVSIGAHCLEEGRCEFVVWAPLAAEVVLHVVHPYESILPMVKHEKGYWKITVDGTADGTRYFYRLGVNTDRPDPASFHQPQGPHGPSEVVDHTSFPWEDQKWCGTPLKDLIIYELHVGTFTEEGTFEAVTRRLDDLKDLGANAVEIMPVAQFPGERNWGYDGVYPFAVQHSYGGPEGLKQLVNACHTRDMSLILDVVYNHLGPEGNYLGQYGPYFTPKYRTLWGSAVNFDDAHSDGVRNFFIENALYWFREYHMDGLRLDAIHGICDMSAKPFLAELAERVEEFSIRQGRKLYLIAESDLNDIRVIQPRPKGGCGIDAQWCDDFHHSLHSLLTGENTGYYADFGRIEHLVKAFREGFVYSWQYSPYRKRHHGSSSAGTPAHQFIAFSQNHDQVGNRMGGERLSTLISFEASKLAAGSVLLSPYIPLLFMGEEYGEDTPFHYFVSHSDQNLIAAVREGRRKEFEAFGWRQEPPDPQSVKTFRRSRLVWKKRVEGKHRILLEFYRTLIQLRRDTPALVDPRRNTIEVTGQEEERLISFQRWHDQSNIFCIMNFSDTNQVFSPSLKRGEWKKILDSSDQKWLGPGSTLPPAIEGMDELTVGSFSFALYEMEASR